MNNEVKNILNAVKNGDISVDQALLRIKTLPFEDIGYAKVDLHRKTVQGAAEVIYGAGKTPDQIKGIVDTMLKNGQKKILITRISKESAEILSQEYTFSYHNNANLGIIGEIPKPDGNGK